VDVAQASEELVEEKLRVLVRQRLLGPDDLVQIGVHELVEHVDVVESRWRRGFGGRRKCPFLFFFLLLRLLSSLPKKKPLVRVGGPQDVFDGDDVVVRAQCTQQGDLSEGPAGVGGVVERAGDLVF